MKTISRLYVAKKVKFRIHKFHCNRRKRLLIYRRYVRIKIRALYYNIQAVVKIKMKRTMKRRADDYMKVNYRTCISSGAENLRAMNVDRE